MQNSQDTVVFDKFISGFVDVKSGACVYLKYSTQDRCYCVMVMEKNTATKEILRSFNLTSSMYVFADTISSRQNFFTQWEPLEIPK